MRPKEIQEKLGINADRIKFFKKEGVFTPENPPSGIQATNYTNNDFEHLQILVVLTKSGLTCSDIRKLQNGVWTMEEALKTRQKSIDEEIERKRNSLKLLSQLLTSKVEFETFDTQRFWDLIKCREATGDEFINLGDLYGYEMLSLNRVIECPHCHENQGIDLGDYLYDESSYENENGMGSDMVYSFDSEDNYECSCCCKRFRISGWIREYPLGAYDSERINVELIDFEGDKKDE